MLQIRRLLLLVLILVGPASAQSMRPPYILGRDGAPVKCKNFLAGRKPEYGATFQLSRKGAIITFHRDSNTFEIVTGAENTTASIEAAKGDFRRAEAVLLRVTGIAQKDRCKLRVLLKIVVPNSTSGGKAYSELPSCETP